MIWKGETLEQRNDREKLGFQRFAFLPTQMSCGTWMWLEKYWCGLHRGPNMRKWYVKALEKQDCIQSTIKRPAPPKPRWSGQEKKHE